MYSSRVNGDDWPPVRNIYDVIDVLMNGEEIAQIHGGEMAQIVLDHAAGTHNRFEGCLASRSRGGPRKSRKPRPNKRARFK
jgi:transcriptional antiterminator NusG